MRRLSQCSSVLWALAHGFIAEVYCNLFFFGHGWRAVWKGGYCVHAEPTVLRLVDEGYFIEVYLILGSSQVRVKFVSN